MSDDAKSTKLNSQTTDRSPMGGREDLLSEMQVALQAADRNLDVVAQKMAEYEKHPSTLRETNMLDVMGTEQSLYTAKLRLNGCMHGVDTEKSRLFEVQKNREAMARYEGAGQIFNSVSEQIKKPGLDGISQRLNEKAEQTSQQADRSVAPQELGR